MFVMCQMLSQDVKLTKYMFRCWNIPGDPSRDAIAASDGLDGSAPSSDQSSITPMVSGLKYRSSEASFSKSSGIKM